VTLTVSPIHEIGIRMALGAPCASVSDGGLRGLKLVAIGAARRPPERRVD
jgi:hypothetical protein